jgi:hypothetical protein
MKKIVSAIFLTVCLFAASAQNNVMTSGDERKELLRQYIKQTPHWMIRENRIYVLRGFTDSTQLNFTKQSDCEFKCIGISDAFLRSILRNGIVDITKSQLDKNDSPFYAVEATADNGESFRVIASPDGEALKIISVQELFKKNNCDCKE